MRSLSVLALGVVLLFSGRASALRPSDIDWTGSRDEIVIEGRNFSGALSDTKKWEGALCEGSLQLGASAKGTVEKIDFDPIEEGKVAVYANLTEVSGLLRGRYVSELSLCIPVGISEPFRLERAEAFADVSFIDQGEGKAPAIAVKIKRTTLYRLQMLELAPPFLEAELTRFANHLLESVWASSLGRWVEEKVAKEFGKIFPQP